MTRHRIIITGVALLAMAAALQAQTPTKTEKVKGTTHVTDQMTGEVEWVQGNTLVAKMQPSGHYSVFIVQPGREFDDRRTDPAHRRPQAWHRVDRDGDDEETAGDRSHDERPQRHRVVGPGQLRDPDTGKWREQRVHVPASFKFMVEGKPASVSELKTGMKVSATKIVEEPQTEISSKMVITGTSPK